MENEEQEQVIGLGVRIDASVYRRLDNYNKATGRTKRHILEAAITNYIDSNPTLFPEEYEHA